MQVGVAGDTVGEQGPDVLLVVVLGQDHDAAPGQHRPDGVGEVDALGRVGRGHPDVGDQHVGLEALRPVHRLGRICRAAHDHDVVLLLQQPPKALAGHEVVFRDEDLHPAGHVHMMAPQGYPGGR